MSNETPTTTIQSALDAALTVIKSHNPNVPSALAVIIAPKKGAHGYFLPNAWQDNGGEHNGSARHEIAMNPQSFDKGAEQVLTTLIHETAHALAHVTGVKDTSRQGRFHNNKFRTIADAMGLVTTDDDKIGTRTPGLQSWAKESYAGTLANLESVLVTFRKPDADKPKAPKTTIRIQCGCEQPVTVPIKWWETMEDVLQCSLCVDDDTDGGRFFPVE